MKYVPMELENQARRAVNFETCGNIDKTGSVRGMIKMYGWLKGGQVRLGGYIYNVGPIAVARLRQLHLLRE